MVAFQIYMMFMFIIDKDKIAPTQYYGPKLILGCCRYAGYKQPASEQTQTLKLYTAKARSDS